MNNKIIIESSDKQSIIEMHLKEKKINLFEQDAEKIDSAKNIFAQAKKFGCLTDPNLDFVNIKYRRDKPEKIYIKAVGPTTGNVKRVYSDYTFEVVSPQNQVIRSGTWKCDQIGQQSPVEQKQTKTKEYFDQWKAYYSGQPQYQGAEIVSELEATPVQKATWIQVSIPNSAKDTGTEKFVYISSSKKKETPADGSKPSEPQSRKEIQQSAQINKDECEKIIEQWYQNYSTKPDDFDKAYFDAERPKAMYCKRRFYKKWGVDFDANRLNKIIEFMSRNRDNFEGRTSPGLRSLWKLD